ncbi:DUF1206 domain-containing protein [Marivita sp. GX14005]|uniref:DUF1206 domain-containing protein n=1 Tax=Marivita sp. GX14005 TaxID=2942276 RepID=UPI002019B730|nr:DUF1206 domain-containing protein [Marivita sp. GX14005]MCL3880692.1 DUF1206 domain-containing protein [Marivita sp. GX14005]
MAEHSQNDKLDWAIPVMRAGYAGRGLTYVVIAGMSLWAIWSGGSAQGTQSALSKLEGTPGGGIVLGLIALGLVAYCVWRVLDAAFDLEDYGTDGKGIVARIGMIVTGVIHAALGIAAFTILWGTGTGGSGISSLTRQALELPMGRFLIGAAGAATVGAGIYYLHKAATQSYHEKLRANHFTVNWNWALQAGVAAQGIIVGIVGGFFLSAAITYDPSDAGGMNKVFEWLSSQPFGQSIVVLICLGLLGFALFCFVNAAYRIVPKASDPDVETLGARLKAKAESA